MRQIFVAIYRSMAKIIRTIKLFYKENSQKFTYSSLVALLLIGIFLVFLFWAHPFNYHFLVYNTAIINSDKVDSLANYSSKLDLIKDLRNDKIILTPQEYTNNVVEYYNTLLTFMAAILVIFSFVAYIQLKFASKNEIVEVLKEKIKDSKEFEDVFLKTLFGKATDKFATLDEIKQYIENEISELREEVMDISVQKINLADSKDDTDKDKE